jgi:nifR3 family TIM-barrel protein
MDTDFISALESDFTPLYLAPQAGVSESPFRRLCRRFGADVVMTEFISADGIVKATDRVKSYLRFDDEERPIGVQIFGSDPGLMAEAAALVTDLYHPEFVDINFGCPVKKVVKRNGGSGCLRDLDLVQRIIRACADAINIPLTVKIRSGFDEPSRDPVGIGLRCQEAGAEVLTLHARTRTDMYTGFARWDEIAAVVEALDIPVIGNGDVRTGEDARRMVDETGCAGVMIARGSHGGPWIFKQARAALEGLPIPPDPDVRTRFEICLEHARNAIAFEPDNDKAMIEFRKHLGWYTKGLPNGKALRQDLFAVTELAEAESLLLGYLTAAEEEHEAMATQPA